MDEWCNFTSVEEWWRALANINDNGGAVRKGLVSILMLVLWEVWNERNARVYRSISSMPSVEIGMIKEEARLGVCCGRQTFEFDHAARVVLCGSVAGSV